MALLSEKQPMHQFTTPESIGALAVFLASDAAATITGSALFDRRRLDRPVISLLARALSRETKPPAGVPKRINLALQGGGAHGAFTWGVLDHLLEDGRLEIDGISGTSAGAVNAVMLADGLARGGPEEARKRLAEFWRAASLGGDLPAVQRAVTDRLFSLLPNDNSAAQNWLSAWSGYLLALRPQPAQHQSAEGFDRALRRFRRSARPIRGRLFVAATNVQTGRLHIFPQDNISAEAVMASACLPAVFRAVEIDGVPYWDGGYLGNPVIYPFFRSTGDRRRADRPDQSAGAQESAAHATARSSAACQRDHLQLFADGRIARDRIRQPADRPRPPAARHRRRRIPPHQRASHRARGPRRAAVVVHQAAQRLRFVRTAAQARPARGAAIPRRALRRDRRAKAASISKRKSIPSARDTMRP